MAQGGHARVGISPQHIHVRGAHFYTHRECPTDAEADDHLCYPEKTIRKNFVQRTRASYPDSTLYRTVAL
jgi:hypothetical protein